MGRECEVAARRPSQDEDKSHMAGAGYYKAYNLF